MNQTSSKGKQRKGKRYYGQTVLRILDEVARMCPYRIPGNRDSYNPYNEGWQEALFQAGAEIEALFSIESEPRCSGCTNYSMIHGNMQSGNCNLHGDRRVTPNSGHCIWAERRKDD